MVQTIKELGDFRAAFLDQRTRKVLDHALRSRRKNNAGIKPWRARDDPNWAITDRGPA
jgi:hypothetical protein